MRADDLIDRRRLRRKLTFWRVAALVVAAASPGHRRPWALRRRVSAAPRADHIAKVRIEGTITEDEELLERLETIRKSAAVKGVILSIDSPGGTTAGGEAIFEAVRALAAEKPVVAQVGTLAASAGYMIASASDHIVARKSSIVGSIGVLVQFPDFTGLMDKVGIKLEEVKSSPLKAEPSPFNPTTDEERAMIRADDPRQLRLVRRPGRRPPAADARRGAGAGRRLGLHRPAGARRTSWSTNSAARRRRSTGSPPRASTASSKVVEWKPRKATAGFFLVAVGGRGVGARCSACPDPARTCCSETRRATACSLTVSLSVWHPEKAVWGD